MQIAVTATRETRFAPLEQNRADGREGEPGLRGQLPRGRRVEEIGPLGESGVVLLDIGLDRARTLRRIPQRPSGVRAADSDRQLVDDLVRQSASSGEAVERRILVEPPHVDEPFDDFALAADPKRLPRSGDRRGRQVDARRRGAVDRDLCLTGAPALIERR